MAIYTNGTRVCYHDAELQAYPVFCTLKGEVISVSIFMATSMSVVDLGLRTTQQNIPLGNARLESGNLSKQDHNEYRRKAHAKFPRAHIF
jgi:hypothetical protein